MGSNGATGSDIVLPSRRWGPGMKWSRVSTHSSHSPLTLVSPNLDLNGCSCKGCVHTTQTRGAARGWVGACGQRRWMREAGWGPRKEGGKRAQGDGRARKEGHWVHPFLWSDLPDHQGSFYHFKFLRWASDLRYVNWFVHGYRWCTGKEFTCQCRRCKRCRFDPLKKEMATCSSILVWRTPWTEKPGGLQSMGSQRVGHAYTLRSGCIETRFELFWNSNKIWTL